MDETKYKWEKEDFVLLTWIIAPFAIGVFSLILSFIERSTSLMGIGMLWVGVSTGIVIGYSKMRQAMLKWFKIVGKDWGFDVEGKRGKEFILHKKVVTNVEQLDNK